MHAAPLFALLRLILKQGRAAGWMHLELDASRLYVVYGNGSQGARTILGPLALPRSCPVVAWPLPPLLTLPTRLLPVVGLFGLWMLLPAALR